MFLRKYNLLKMIVVEIVDFGRLIFIEIVEKVV